MEETTATAVEEVPTLASMSDSDRAKYLETGELPTNSSEGTEKSEAKSGAVSETAENDQESTEKPHKSRYQRKIDRLTAQIKQLEADALANRNRSNESAPRQAVSSDKTTTTAKAPRLKSFTDQIGTKYQDYDTAHEAWQDALDDHYAKERSAAVADALKSEQTRLERAKEQERVEKTTEKNAKEFAKRAQDFRKTLKEDSFNEHFLEVKEAIDEVIKGRPEMGELADFLVESEVGPELIQYFGEHIDELDALLEMPLSRATRELGKLEVSDKIKAPQPKKTTAAKRIGSSVSGGAASSNDPVESAIEKGDVMAYITAMNAREAAERRK
jgi:hypothetical protein